MSRVTGWLITHLIDYGSKPFSKVASLPINHQGIHPFLVFYSRQILSFLLRYLRLLPFLVLFLVPFIFKKTTRINSNFQPFVIRYRSWVSVCFLRFFFMVYDKNWIFVRGSVMWIFLIRGLLVDRAMIVMLCTILISTGIAFFVAFCC